MTKHFFTLSDDRRLCYAQVGPVAGTPVLYFHGTPSSRLEVLLPQEYGLDLPAVLEQLHLRLLVVDRPGLGGSDFNPQGTFTSFAHDLRQLLQHLHISTCHLLCWSGGGPFGLTMAYLYPTVIKTVFILCGFTRPLDREVMRQMGTNKWYFRAARTVPPLAKLALRLACRHQQGLSVPRRLVGLPPVDYDLIRDRQRFRKFSALTLREACSQGARGAVYEAALYFRELGFELSDIVQPVHYWWGTEDCSVIRAHAAAAEQQIFDCTMHYKEGEGHFSLYLRYFREVLDAIAAAGPVE
ncbi:alpha/beta hydrolase [Paraflavisolibacter sp. H34]|uniref:alpha/beta fold hydrolase n=1 Tax=Huijunlia imazamoxiresistens TaxID=3127457 RepID=UPI00301726CA